MDLEVDDVGPTRLDEQDRVVNAHAGMHRRHNPFAAGRPARVV